MRVEIEKSVVLIVGVVSGLLFANYAFAQRCWVDRKDANYNYNHQEQNNPQEQNQGTTNDFEQYGCNGVNFDSYQEGENNPQEQYQARKDFEQYGCEQGVLAPELDLDEDSTGKSDWVNGYKYTPVIIDGRNMIAVAHEEFGKIYIPATTLSRIVTLTTAAKVTPAENRSRKCQSLIDDRDTTPRPASSNDGYQWNPTELVQNRGGCRTRDF